MNYELLPKVDLIVEEVQRQLAASAVACVRPLIVTAARDAVSLLRGQMDASATREELFDTAVSETLARYRDEIRPSLRRVVNATGVILHTNLGRAPLAEAAARAAYDAARGYVNLEMNLDCGARGSRYEHVVRLLRYLTGAEDAVVVNNNAAAVLLALDTLCSGTQAREVVVSRGQLVEIGGSFRIPDVIESSRATLREVGTTNKTHLYDYENAICEATACLFQVHPSNFIMKGFVDSVSTAKLAKLAHRHNLPLVYDLGSGYLFPCKGIEHEPPPAQSIAAGTDILTFSGDKLLGGPQAGIIAGRRLYLDKISKNPLMRALRPDKMTLAALETTLALYRDRCQEKIPVISMLSVDEQTLEEKALRLQEALTDCPDNIRVTKTEAPVGGGSLPGISLPAWIVEIIPIRYSVDALAKRLQAGTPAVLGYTRENRLCLNLRTVFEEELEMLAAAIKEALL